MTGDIDVSGVFGRALELLGRNLAMFAPLALLLVALPNLWPIAFRGLGPGSFGASFAADTAGLVQIPILLLGLFYQVIVIAACLNDVERGEARLADASAVALRLFLPALGVAILSWVVIILGMIALIVPGIIAYCMFAVAIPALIAERPGVTASLSRSRTLTEGNRVPIFGVYFVLSCIQWIAALLFNLVLVSATSNPIARVFAAALIATLDALIRGPLAAALYVELRSAKEGGLNESLVQVFE